MDKLGSALGSGLSALGGFVGSPTMQQWGQNMMPANLDTITSTLGSSGDPTLSSYFSGGTSTDPNAPVDPASIAGPVASALGPTGGVGFNPAMGSEAALSTLGTGVTDPATNTPLGGSPVSSGVLASLFPSLFGSGGGGTAAAGGAAPGATTPSLLSSILKASPELITGLLKYQQQQNLLDPKTLEQNAAKVNQAQVAQLRKSVFPGVTAQLQETGNINAPYLAAQAYTTAIAPLVAQMQEASMNQWLEANREAMGLYPGQQDWSSALGGFTDPNIFGGGR